MQIDVLGLGWLDLDLIGFAVGFDFRVGNCLRAGGLVLVLGKLVELGFGCFGFCWAYCLFGLGLTWFARFVGGMAGWVCCLFVGVSASV